MRPLSLRLWRMPAGAGAVTVRRSGAAGPGVVVRRGSTERVLAHGALRIAGGQGPVLVLVAGGAVKPQQIRLTVSA